MGIIVLTNNPSVFSILAKHNAKKFGCCLRKVNKRK